MDKDRAIATFVRRARELARLPLITGAELRKLYGREVAEALSVLHRFDRENGLCLRCGAQCCADIGCELYAPQFRRCPIYGLRPVACRLHYCHRFDAAGRSLVLGLRDIFAASLAAAEEDNSDIARRLDCPPLAPATPEFTAAILPLIRAVRRGSLTPQTARTLIRREAGKHHAGLPAES